MIKISVIIPVYNVENYLKRCIESVIKQTYKNLEIILVDDGSTDHSADICDEYAQKDKRIIVIHKKNGGLSSARNAGIGIATGDFIGFVDSDDYISENMYRNLLALILKGNYDISVCGICRTDGKRKWIKRDRSIVTYKRDEYLKKILKINSHDPNHFACNKLYKKELFEDSTVRYPESLTCEDVEGTFRIILKSKKIIESKWVGYYYWINPESITASKYGKNNLDLFQICDHIIRLAINYGNPEIIYGAILYKKRIYFANLCKIAISEIEPGFNEIEIIRMCLKHLRKDYMLLVSSNIIPLNRKIIITCMCINYSISARIMKLFNRLLNGIIKYRV
ncbi:MAG: glycosyltransferase [Lachnospiraceae bacterium]|nr:glycosyltransferase [Lachnospiraceae bacterium]